MFIVITNTGKEHGKGKCIFANGDSYDGDWVEG